MKKTYQTNGSSSSEDDSDSESLTVVHRYAIKKTRPSSWLVDMKYQREPEIPRVEKYSARFREEMFGVPVLSERDNGDLYVIDGNHRRLTCIKLGDDKPRASMVITGMSVEQEAELFHALQKERRGHTAYGQFKARQTMREPVALDIVATLRRHGKVVAEYKNEKSIAAVRALEAAYNRGTLDQTLSVLCGWDRENPSAFDGPIINYVSRFFQVYGAMAAPAHLTSRLAKETPASLVRWVKEDAKDFGYSTNRACVITLRRIYNRKTKKSLTLPLPEDLSRDDDE